MTARSIKPAEPTITYVVNATKLAYTLSEAAEQVGYSDEILRQAIRRGELDASYGTVRKPVIRATELVRWLDALPTEKPNVNAA